MRDGGGEVQRARLVANVARRKQYAAKMEAKQERLKALEFTRLQAIECDRSGAAWCRCNTAGFCHHTLEDEGEE